MIPSYFIQNFIMRFIHHGNFGNQTYQANQQNMNDQNNKQFQQPYVDIKNNLYQICQKCHTNQLDLRKQTRILQYPFCHTAYQKAIFITFSIIRNRMAFVFCDDRWKKNKQNKQPGQGQYGLQTPFNNENDVLSQPRPVTSFKKKRNDNSNTKPQQKAVGFQQWLNSGIFKRDIEFMNQQTENAKIRKGKLYRNATCILKKNENLMGDQQKQYDFKINNQKEHTWRNKKIVQRLNDHKQKESKTDLVKKSCSSTTLLKHNINSYHLRQKQQGNFKELKPMLPEKFKREQVNNGLKGGNREKSAKQKTREVNNHSYSKTEVKSELTSIEQHFEICPSNVYKSPQRQQEQVTQKLSTTAKHLKIISKEQSLPTGTSDYLFQDSMEYIDTNTPGPGSYSIKSSAITVKPKSKVQQFGVTMQRFKLPQKIFHPQTPINPSYPDFKATSQVNQQAVGFGTTTKEQKPSKPVHNGVFYEDSCNFENKVKKIQVKGHKQKIVFGSCKQRFDSQGQKKDIEEYSESDENEEQVDQREVDKKIKIPTNIFLSKVKRDFPVNTSTEDVDYSGQNYNCLAYKLKKEKEFYQDYEIKAAPFSSKQQRFKSIEEPAKKEKEVELKIEKVEQSKKKKEKVKLKQEKGFRFPKQIRQNSQQKIKKQSPSPNKYLNSPKWVKSSYNIRFS